MGAPHEQSSLYVFIAFVIVNSDTFQHFSRKALWNVELQELVEKARHTKVRKRLTDLEVYRMINTILSTGAEPQAITQYLGIPASEREAMIQKAERVEPIRAGFSSGSPYEICQRYYVGELTRAQAIDELVRWEYKPQAKGEEWDPWGMEGGAPEVPGSWDDLDTAEVHKLIDYDLVLEVSRTRAAIRRAAEG